MPNPPTIILAGGGTAGPVTPLLAVAAELKKLLPDARFLWIGTRGGPEERLVAASGISFVAIPCGKLRRYWSWRNFLAPFETLAGLVAAWRLLGRERASLVLSAGGFVAAPVVWAAWARRVPSHVHQQDLRATLTNVITAPFASSMSVAFEKSRDDFARYRPEVTGNPVRPEVLAATAEEGRAAFSLEVGVPTVLVIGGGGGSASLNALVRDSLPQLTAIAQVIHVAGQGKAAAPSANPRYRQFELLTKEMPAALAAADLIVTRAGLGTLSELAVLGKPALIVPIAGSHQEDNARFFVGAGAASSLDERVTFSKAFADKVLALLADEPRRRQMAEAMRRMNPPDAAARVAALAAKLVKETK